VGVAWKRPDGRVQVMLADYQRGTAWLDTRVSELRARWGGSVVVDTASRGLVQDANELALTEQAQAHAALVAAVDGGTVRHGNEDALNIAVRSARWRAMGDTQVLDRKSTTDVTPLVAVALAFHALNTRQRGGWMVGI
jgi:hypothetical protein